MTKSTITIKYQTTVPKEVREKLGVGPSDVLSWEVAGDHVRVTAAEPEFLKLQGSTGIRPLFLQPTYNATTHRYLITHLIDVEIVPFSPRLNIHHSNGE